MSRIKILRNVWLGIDPWDGGSCPMSVRSVLVIIISIVLAEYFTEGRRARGGSTIVAVAGCFRSGSRQSGAGCSRYVFKPRGQRPRLQRGSVVHSLRPSCLCAFVVQFSSVRSGSDVFTTETRRTQRWRSSRQGKDDRSRIQLPKRLRGGWAERSDSRSRRGTLQRVTPARRWRAMYRLVRG